MKPQTRVVILQTIIIFSDISYLLYFLTGSRIFAILAFPQTVRIPFSTANASGVIGSLGTFLRFLPLAYLGWLFYRRNDNPLLQSANPLGIGYLSLYVYSILLIPIRFIAFTRFAFSSNLFILVNSVTALLVPFITLVIIILSFRLEHPNQELQHYRRYLIVYSFILLMTDFIIPILAQYYLATSMVRPNASDLILYLQITSIIGYGIMGLSLIFIMWRLDGLFDTGIEVEDSNLAYPQKLLQQQ